MNCAPPIQVLLFAGYDTTGITLGYVAYLLALHPGTQDRLRDAVDKAFEDKLSEKIQNDNKARQKNMRNDALLRGDVINALLLI